MIHFHELTAACNRCVFQCLGEEAGNTEEMSLPEHLKKHERVPLIENPEVCVYFYCMFIVRFVWLLYL